MYKEKFVIKIKLSKEQKNLVGKRFDRLLVLSEDKSNKLKKHKKYICLCDCGTIKSIIGRSLNEGSITSCGCKRKEGRKRKLNKYEFNDNYIIGYTSNTNKEFYVDLENFNLIKNFTWQENNKGYIITQVKKENLNSKKISLHHLILGIENGKGIIIDHKDRNRANNRKYNLRIANSAQNRINSIIRKDNKYGFTGVYNRDNRFYSKITVGGKDIHLGGFDTKKEAIIARINAEIKYYGEFSKYYNKLIIL